MLRVLLVAAIAAGSAACAGVRAASPSAHAVPLRYDTAAAVSVTIRAVVPRRVSRLVAPTLHQGCDVSRITPAR